MGQQPAKRCNNNLNGLLGKRIKHLESESTTRMRRQERQYKSYVYEHLFDPFKHQLEICHHPE